MSVYNLYHMH